MQEDRPRLLPCLHPRHVKARDCFVTGLGATVSLLRPEGPFCELEGRRLSLRRWRRKNQRLHRLARPR